MKRTRKQYTVEFKIKAVERLLSSGKSLWAVSKELGVDHKTLTPWVAAYKNGRLKLSNAIAVSANPRKAVGAESKSYVVLGKNAELPDTLGYKTLESATERAKELARKFPDEKYSIYEMEMRLLTSVKTSLVWED